MTKTFFTIWKSPLGRMLLTSNGKALTRLHLETKKEKILVPQEWIEDEKNFKSLIKQLDLYFKGKLKKFDIALLPHGTTFQQRVWESLCTVPYGTTISYGGLAKKIHQPTAARAVGMANNRNPIGIIIPCHRVIGSDGSLVGYGGGLEIKQKLLDLEKTGVLPSDFI
ncbi:MAG: methylated-DNA--[protein]-cysteine S-methyltransferase [Alphaproteobacteria bacterium]|nr:methylated-DNA--[protein]-cysteine S-methyltransferase [Alphaproteobacteria bacterium]